MTDKEYLPTKALADGVKEMVSSFPSWLVNSAVHSAAREGLDPSRLTTMLDLFAALSPFPEPVCVRVG